MGIIEEVNAKASAVGGNHAQLLTDGILEALEAVKLASSEYVGNVDTALMHHLEQDAFYIKSLWLPSHGCLHLAREILAREDGSLIPVVVSYHTEPDNNKSETETALVLTNPAGPLFRSTVDHETNVDLRGYTDMVAVTKRTLSLIGRTTITGSDIFNPDDQSIGNSDSDDSFVLNQTSQIDPRNRRQPIRLAYANTNAVVARARDLERDARVGWQHIAGGIVKGVYSAHDSSSPSYMPHRNEEEYLLRVRDFLETSGGLEAISRIAPNLDQALSYAHLARQAINSLWEA